MFRKYPRPEKVWHIEEIGVILFMMTLPLEAMAIMGSGGLTFAKLFLILTFPYWAMRAFFRKDPWLLMLPFKSPTSLTILALLLATGFSIFNITSKEYLGGAITRYLLLYFTVLLIANAVRERKQTLHWVIVALAIGAIPNSVGGLYELATHDQLLKSRASGTGEHMALRKAFGKEQTELSGGEGGKRVVSFSGGAGEHAIHSIVYACASGVLPFVARGVFMQGLAWILVGIHITNVVATGSRTGIIGMFLAGCTFLIFIEIRRKWLVLVLAVAGALLVSVVFDLPMARLLQKTSQARGTVEARIQQFQVAINMVERHPILGVGPGNYITEYHRYHEYYPSHDRVIIPGPLHNAILNQMAEGGLMSTLMFIVLIVVVIVKCWIVRFISPDPYMRVVAVAVMSAFIGWCGGLLFYPTFFDEQGWILMGVTIGLWNVHRGIMRTAALQAKAGAP